MLKQSLMNRPIFPPRRLDSHKGDYGRLFIIAGSLGMSGAALLAAKGALRTGAGLVFLGVPSSLTSVVESAVLEVIAKPLTESKKGFIGLKAYSFICEFSKQVDALILGPGLSRNRETERLIRELIKVLDKPLVVDADALNALSVHLDVLLQRKAEMIITPHPGEFARLLKKSVEEIEKEREKLTLEFARRYKLTVVLKGYGTVVSSAKGEVYVNHTGNPGMATAGMGDVLSGMIGSLLARGFSCFEAAKLGVYLHGLAGDLSAQEKGEEGMIASDLIEMIPEAIKKEMNRH